MIEKENTPVQNTPVECENKQKKMRGKKGYVIIFLAIFLFCAICALHQFTNRVSATIMINSVLSADGQNPDGTPFSIMELFSDAVMERAVEKLNGKLTAQELRNHLTVSDTMTNTSFAKLEQSIFDGEDEDTYFPTEYLLTYSTISEQIQHEGFWAQCKSFFRSFFLPSKTKILNAVLQSYQEYYGEMYLDYDSLFNIDWSVVDSMDYYNRFAFMDDVAQRLGRFLQFKNAQTSSRAKGDTYYDLIVELNQGPLKNIKNYQAYILQYGVTVNKEELLRQFAYMQELSEEENARKKQEYDVLRGAIELYDATTTKVVFIPALDGNDEFYMNRTKVGLDYLSEKADTAKLQADSAAHAAKQYAYLQTCFGEEYIVDENGDLIQIRNTPAQRAHADELCESLKADIQRLIAQLAALKTNGQGTNQDYLIMGSPFANVSMISVAVSGVKKFVLLSMAAYVVIYAVTAVKESKQEKEQEVEQ